MQQLQLYWKTENGTTHDYRYHEISRVYLLKRKDEIITFVYITIKQSFSLKKKKINYLQWDN